MWKLALISTLLLPLAAYAADAPSVYVDPSVPQTPRPMESQTRTAVVRDYLQSWKALQTAFEQNRTDLLNADFVGGALKTLDKTIRAQSALGITTRYDDLSHRLQIVYYSPEGLSIELLDRVSYTVQVFDHGRPVARRQEHARYIVVMTPSQVRWRTRIFEANPA